VILKLVNDITVNFRQRLIKRIFDCIASGIGLLMLWPLILVCAWFAKRDTGVSGVFTQARVGRHGRTFLVRKIRTMGVERGQPRNTITVDGDPRITRSGRVMRRFKLDELPQLWNVFVGDMSLVGPRPDVPGYADRLVGEQRKILQLRPGITGPATIKYRNEERVLSKHPNPINLNDRVLYPDKVRINLDYLRDWSLKGDIRYLLMTARLLAPPPALEFDDLLLEGD